MDSSASFARWMRFREALVRQLRATEHADLARAWVSSAARTRFYASNLFDRVALDLDLTVKPEHLLVDYVFCTHRDNIPVIFIESENDAFSAEHEVWKLCALASPVRVLVSVAEWDTDGAVWPHGGVKTERLRKWRDIADGFAREYTALGGVLAAVIGEWRPDDTFRVYAHRLGGVDWIGDTDGCIFEQKMTVRQPVLSAG